MPDDGTVTMGDFFGAFKGLVRGGIDVLLTPLRSRKRGRPAEVVDEVVPDDQDRRPAKRRLAMTDDELVRVTPPFPSPLRDIFPLPRVALSVLAPYSRRKTRATRRSATITPRLEGTRPSGTSHQASLPDGTPSLQPWVPGCGRGTSETAARCRTRSQPVPSCQPICLAGSALRTLNLMEGS